MTTKKPAAAKSGTARPRTTAKPAAAKTSTAAAGRTPAPKAAAKPAKAAARKSPARATKAAAPKTGAKAAAKPVKPAVRKSPARATKAAAPKTGAKAAAKPAKTAARKSPVRVTKAAATSAGLPARTGTRKKTARTAKPKGLEAQYSGRIFRSRLEARWAILLDLLDINWDYEPSHYQVGPALWYLPDFYLPEHRLWLEVKGPVFMDAQSMAKCIGSVAGPMPLPLREAPYTAADRLLIGGPIRLRRGMTARHTLVTRDPSGKAALSYAFVSRRGISVLGEPWDRMEANGVAKARRPVPERLQVLVDPDPAFGVLDSEAERAYRIAAGAVFDDATKALSGATDQAVIRELSRRRGGRPLGPFPAS